MPKTDFDKSVMLIVTGITNFCMAPAIYNLHRQELVFEAFIGAFTMITSFLYHVCDSIDSPLWLTEGQWHRLDNIGSIMSFICWSIYLMDLKNQAQIKYLQYFFLALVLIFQEKNPWDEFNSGIPIIVSFVLLFSNYIRHGKFPSYDYQPMRRGLMLLAFGVGCFIRGLDDDNDPFRFFHGCWHAFVGASAYYNFKVLPMVQSHRRRNSPRSHLPIKKI